jgi:hypothetical protein
VKLDFGKDFIIYTNAIKEAIYAILLQCDEQKNEKPIAYMSQSLSDNEIKYSYIEKHAFFFLRKKRNSIHPKRTKLHF